MKKQKPSIPRGTRDFGPDKMYRRLFILNTIKSVFEKFGFQPLETPAMEKLSVLTGKYGDEGDKLLYKILNSGDFLSKVSYDGQTDSKQLAANITEKGLRYDLTVPFARYVVMSQHDIVFPFKRYQIQPVWRADRPQKGRYREFYQCDADVVGTSSMLCEAEIVQMINEVMLGLGISDFTIKVNNRKLLTSISEWAGAHGKEGIFCVAIDKLDKIGQDNVVNELRDNGFSEQSLEKLNAFFEVTGDNEVVLEGLGKMLQDSTQENQGLTEIRSLMSMLADMELSDHHVKISPTLARGLSYYTGTILEVAVNNSSMTSSISGGGRYDNLTGVFGLEGVSGVGFSFGVDRIYDVMEDLQLFPERFEASTKVLLLNFGAESMHESLKVISKLRASNIKSELYPDSVKIKKQMNYANRKNIPFVLMIGEEEMLEGKYLLKNMSTGHQEKFELQEIIARLS